jgi:mRNA interferase YafQ
MLDVVLSNHFKKDLKQISKRGYNLDLLDEVVEKLARMEPLPEKNRDHGLTGDFVGLRECHIQPDWLSSIATIMMILSSFFLARVPTLTCTKMAQL